MSSISDLIEHLEQWVLRQTATYATDPQCIIQAQIAWLDVIQVAGLIGGDPRKHRAA